MKGKISLKYGKEKSNTISKEEHRKLLEQLDKEDLIIINEAYEKKNKRSWKWNSWTKENKI